jgi:hypothetical protein
MVRRRSAYPTLGFVTAILAAIVAPTPDAVTMLIWRLVLMVVFFVLFEAAKFLFGW